MKADWPLTTLGEILTERQQTTSIEHILSGEIPIVSKISFDDGRIEFRDNFDTKTGMILIGPGDLVVSGINAAKGAIAIYDEKKPRPIAATIHYASYIPNKDKIDIRYLWWFLRSNEFREILNRNVPGGIKTELKAKRFLPIPIPLPTLSEQHRIVAKIEQIASKIEQAKNLRQEATNESALILQSAMNDIWNNTEGWNIKPLKLLVTLVSGQVDPTVAPYANMPHINGESMESGTGRLINNYHSAREDDVKSGKYYFRPDTVLYSKIRPYLRKSVFVPFEGVCSADIYAFESIHSDIESNFLKYSLISPPFTSYANRISGRTRMPKLNRKQLFSYSLPYPRKDEQMRIVNHLDNVLLESERIKQLQEQTATEIDDLLPSILDKAFKGEL